jgi:hypothetical protein
MWSETSWDFDLRRPLFLKDVPNLKILTIDYRSTRRDPYTGSIIPKVSLLKERFGDVAPIFEVNFEIRALDGRRIRLRRAKYLKSCT